MAFIRAILRFPRKVRAALTAKATFNRTALFSIFGLSAIIWSILLMNVTPPYRSIAVTARYERSNAVMVPLSYTPSAEALIVKPPDAPPAIESAAAPRTEITLPPLINGTTAVGETDLHYLRERGLLIPVKGIVASQLRDSFHDARGEGRLHHAIDIMAPEGTPVLAAADGVIRKLHTSDKGGVSLYEADSAGSYVYFYGHLQRYADEIYEGKAVRRGEVIGYVGDTGNAGSGNFHLHFGISKTAPGKWGGGEPINPFDLFAGRPDQK
jgi:murein DD-endopeptidase MepM/ murein hydrolase activator NlpD